MLGTDGLTKIVYLCVFIALNYIKDLCFNKETSVLDYQIAKIQYLIF